MPGGFGNHVPPHLLFHHVLGISVMFAMCHLSVYPDFLPWKFGKIQIFFRNVKGFSLYFRLWIDRINSKFSVRFSPKSYNFLKFLNSPQDLLLQRAIMQSQVWNTDEDKLPRPLTDPRKPIWKWKRKQGITRLKSSSVLSHCAFLGRFSHYSMLSCLIFLFSLFSFSSVYFNHLVLPCKD